MTEIAPCNAVTVGTTGNQTMIGTVLEKQEGKKPRHGKWIPVKERLPDNVEFPANYDSVLISIEGAVYKAYRIGHCWYISGSAVEFNDSVDAWMPLPKPYDE